MKKLLIIAILVIFSYNLYSQNTEPTAFEFIYDRGQTLPQIFNPNDHIQTKMLFGFQWEAFKSTNDALGNTGYAGSWYVSKLDNTANPLQMILQPHWMNASDYVPGFWNAPFMTYEPTLSLNGTNFGHILKPDDEINNPVFGFKTRLGDTLTDPQDENYSRLILSKTLSPSHNAVIVLKEIEPQPKFKTMTSFYFNQAGMTDKYYGKKWYLTVNLRRLDPENETDDDDQIVLRLKIKYKLGNNNTGDIVFDKIPMQGLTNIEALNFKENRGKAQLLEPAQTTYEMLIRRNMLPITVNDPDITISASFFCTEAAIPNPNLNQNPMFTDSDEATKIKEFDIEVEYYGYTDLAIDYVRVESINAHSLLRGEVDEIAPNPNEPLMDRRGRIQIYSDPDDPTFFEEPADIQNLIQSALDGMIDLSNNWEKGKLFRFYYQDTESDKFYWWGPLRYANLVTNGMHVPRDEHVYPKIYEYYTKSRTRWIGAAISNADGLLAAPFLRNGLSDWNENWKTMGLKFGYIGCNNSLHFIDSLESKYETALYGDNDNLGMLSNDTYYYETLLSPSNMKGFQAAWEGHLYRKYYKTETKQSELLYSDIHWLDYFIFYNIKLKNINGDQRLMNNYKRQKSGEELRLYMWSNVLRGCKGMLFDGDWNLKLPILSAGQASIGDNTLLPAEDLYSDLVGSDFIDANNTWNWNDALGPYVDQSILSTNMKIQPNRAFIGTKSIRTELWKMNQFIIKNNDLLMDLRLAASYSKGFRTWYNQDGELGTENVMNRFLSLGLNSTPNRLKTRKLWNAKENAQQESYELFDSSFVDFSLLRPSQDESLEGNVFYIGVQNRRTDPLIYYTEPRYDLIMPPPAPTGPFDKKYLKFLSTAEFDILTQSGGKDPDYTFSYNLSASHWRNYYWKRLGCREITIPFNYCDPNNGNDYNLLHITEVKADENDSERANWPWWRKERYDNYVDVVIGQNGSLPVNFLPGEGKIFKVEVLKPEPLSGNLAYSNQSKFVEFPEYVDDVATEKVRYHLTYTKPNTNPSPYKNGIMSVFYRRSAPMEKVTNKENLQIDWEQEICVSDNLFVYGFRGDHTFPDPQNPQAPIVPCYYPSLVVRREGTSTKAYVVFSAEAEGQFVCPENYCPPNIDLCHDFLNPICEAILNVGGPVVSWPGQSNAIQNVVHGFRDNYGTPVINSSYLGNYYAWSDSLCGIVVGYKAAGQTILTQKESFSNKFDFNPNVPNYANHPSINAYSILGKQENDCSVVWQESEDLNSATSIYYTKFRLNYSGSLERFLPSHLSKFSRVEMENSCIKLSYDVSAEMPTVYRLLSTVGTSVDNYMQYEVVAWHTNPNLNIEKRTILNIYYPTLYTPDWAYVYPIRKIIGNNSIMSPINLFSNPVMSQITSYNLGNSLLPVGGSQYEYLLNFEDNWENNGLGSGNKIFHLRESCFPNDVKLSDFGVKVYPVAEGKYPHLAYSPVENVSGNVWKNHRVYNQGVMESYDRIVPNPIYFHPYNDCPSCKIMQKIVGFDDDLIRGGGIGNTKMSIPGIPVPEPLPINLPYQSVSDSLGEYVIPVQQDTIYTDWVLIDSTAELQYLVTMKDTTTVLIKLQKLSDSSFVDIPAPFTPGVVFSHQVFYLVNGNNDQYRLAMINTDSTLEYGENMYFEAPFVIDTIYAKSSFEVKQNVINLNKHILIDKIFNLSCMPNPAKEILNVAVYANQNTNVESVVLQLYNQQGMMVWENNSRINSTAAIPVDDFSNGMYLIRANITTKDGYYTETSKVLILK